MNTVTLGAGLLMVAVVIAAIFFLRPRRPTNEDDTVFAQMQKQQETLWSGVPLTVVFDYQPYLKDVSRHRVNVHTVQRDAQGVHSVVGYCHDSKEDRVFLSHSIRGDMLVEKVDESISFTLWLEQLQAGAYE
ncbi:MAG: hypothetical protein AAF493_26100 [Pseudomonadota bacterium]